MVRNTYTENTWSMWLPATKKGLQTYFPFGVIIKNSVSGIRHCLWTMICRTSGKSLSMDPLPVEENMLCMQKVPTSIPRISGLEKIPVLNPGELLLSL